MLGDVFAALDRMLAYASPRGSAPATRRKPARRRRVGKTVVIGDSLAVGTAPHLRGVKADARTGRPSSEGVKVLRRKLRPDTSTVVFDLGTNDASAAELGRSLRKVRRIAGDRRVIVPTVNSPYQQRQKNKLIRREARRGNIETVNWGGRARRRGLLAGDQVHATNSGYAERARLLDDAISDRGPAVSAAATHPVRQRTIKAHASKPGQKVLPKSVYDAINKEMTPAFGRWAQKTYGVGGKKLLALVYAAEGGGSIDEGSSNTSYAGARGPGQFIASTRAAYMDKYGIDPWKNDRSAVRGSMIHLKGTGVAGYNPGMASYQDLVMGQSVDTSPLRTGGRASSSSGKKTTPFRLKESSKLAFDKAGYEKARKAAIVGNLIAGNRGTEGILFKTGVLTTTMPTKSEFMDTELSSKIVGGGPIPGVKSQRNQGPIPSYGPSGGTPTKAAGAPLDRAGVATKPHVRKAVDYISSILGSPIQFGTGTAHSQMTVSGNQSQHWTGDAIDLPATGKRLMAMGRSALIAAGMDPKQARKASGGLYNINGWQIIFNTQEGGDHTDHLHAAPPAGWKQPRKKRRRR